MTSRSSASALLQESEGKDEDYEQKFRMRCTHVPEMYQSALMDDEYMGQLLIQMDALNKKRDKKNQRTASLARITFWVLLVQAIVGVLLFLWKVVLTPDLLIQFNGALWSAEAQFMIQTNQGMYHKWNPQQSAVAAFVNELHKKYAMQKKDTYFHIEEELNEKVQNSKTWFRKVFSFFLDWIAPLTHDNPINLGGGFTSVSAGAFQVYSAKPEEMKRRLSDTLKMCSSDDLLDEKALPEEERMELKKFFEGETECHDSGQAEWVTNEKMLKGTSAQGDVDMDKDTAHSMVEKLKNTSFPDNSVRLADDFQVDQDSRLKKGIVVMGYKTPEDFQEKFAQLDGGKQKVKYLHPDKYRGAAVIMPALEHCAAYPAEDITEQLCIIIGDTSGTCQVNDYTDEVQEYCQTNKCDPDLMGIKSTADLRKDNWKPCIDFVKEKKLNIVLMLISETERQTNKLLSNKEYAKFIEQTTDCKIEEKKDGPRRKFYVPGAEVEDTNVEMSEEERKNRLNCAKVIIATTFEELKAKARILASLQKSEPANWDSPDNPEKDMRFVVFLLLCLPLVIYIFFIQIIECIRRLRHRAKALAGKKKRRIRIAKRLVKRPSTNVRKSLAELRQQLGDVELASMAAMRTPLMSGATINLRAKLKGAYVRAPHEEGEPILADAKAVDRMADWKIERASGYGIIMEGDKCYLKDEEGNYLALAESEDGTQALITVKDREMAQMITFSHSSRDEEPGSSMVVQKLPIRLGDTVKIQDQSGNFVRAIRAERNQAGEIIGDNDGFMDFQGQPDGYDVLFDVDVGGDVLLSDTMLVIQHELSGKYIEAQKGKGIELEDEGSAARFMTIEKYRPPHEKGTGDEDESLDVKADLLMRGDQIMIRNVHGEYFCINPDDPTKLMTAPLPEAQTGTGTELEPSQDMQRFLFSLDKLGVDVDRKDSTIRLEAAVALRSMYGDRPFIKATSDGTISADGTRLDNGIGFKITADDAYSELQAKKRGKRAGGKGTMNQSGMNMSDAESFEAAKRRQEKARAAGASGYLMTEETEINIAKKTKKVKNEMMAQALAAIDEREVEEEEAKKKKEDELRLKEEEEAQKKEAEEKEQSRFKWKVITNTNYVRGGGVMRIDYGAKPLPPSALRKQRLDATTGGEVTDASKDTGRLENVGPVEFVSQPSGKETSFAKVQGVTFIDEETFIHKEFDDQFDELDEHELAEEARLKAAEDQLPEESDYMIDYQFEAVEVDYDTTNEELAEEEMLEVKTTKIPIPKIKKIHFFIVVGILLISTVILMAIVISKTCSAVRREQTAPLFQKEPKEVDGLLFVAPPALGANDLARPQMLMGTTRTAVKKPKCAATALAARAAELERQRYVRRRLEGGGDGTGTLWMEVVVVGSLFPPEVHESGSLKGYEGQTNRIEEALWLLCYNEYVLHEKEERQFQTVKVTTPVKKSIVLLKRAQIPQTEGVFTYDDRFNEYRNSIRFEVDLGNSGNLARHMAMTMCKLFDEARIINSALRAVELADAFPSDTADSAVDNSDLIIFRAFAEWKVNGKPMSFQCTPRASPSAYKQPPVDINQMRPNGDGTFSCMLGWKPDKKDVKELKPFSPREVDDDSMINQWNAHCIPIEGYCPQVDFDDGAQSIEPSRVHVMISWSCAEGHIPHRDVVCKHTDSLVVTSVEPSEDNDKIVVNVEAKEKKMELFWNNESASMPLLARWEGTEEPSHWVSEIYKTPDDKMPDKITQKRDNLAQTLQSGKVLMTAVKLTIRCNPGTIEHGTWSNIPKCEPLKCDTLPEVKNAKLLPDFFGTQYGEYLTLECQEAYIGEGGGTTVKKKCGKNYLFEDSEEACILDPEYCPETEIQDAKGKLPAKPMDNEAVESVECKTGYQSLFLGRTVNAKCILEKKWNLFATMKKIDKPEGPELQRTVREQEQESAEEVWIGPEDADETGILAIRIRGETAITAMELLTDYTLPSLGQIYVVAKGDDKYEVKTQFKEETAKCVKIPDFCKTIVTDNQNIIRYGGIDDTAQLEPKAGWKVKDGAVPPKCQENEDGSDGAWGEFNEGDLFEKIKGYCQKISFGDATGGMGSFQIDEAEVDEEKDVKCPAGYKHKNEKKLKCVDGGWDFTGMEGPLCVQVECPKPEENTLNAKLLEEEEVPQEGKRHLFEAEARYQCDLGYCVTGDDSENGCRMFEFLAKCDHKEGSEEGEWVYPKGCDLKEKYCKEAKPDSDQGWQGTGDGTVTDKRKPECSTGWKPTEDEEKKVTCEPVNKESGKWVFPDGGCEQIENFCEQRAVPDVVRPIQDAQTSFSVQAGYKKGFKIGDAMDDKKDKECPEGYQENNPIQRRTGTVSLKQKSTCKTSKKMEPDPMCYININYCPKIELCEEGKLKYCDQMYLDREVLQSDYPCPTGYLPAEMAGGKVKCKTHSQQGSLMVDPRPGKFLDDNDNPPQCLQIESYCDGIEFIGNDDASMRVNAAQYASIADISCRSGYEPKQGDKKIEGTCGADHHFEWKLVKEEEEDEELEVEKKTAPPCRKIPAFCKETNVLNAKTTKNKLPEAEVDQVHDDIQCEPGYELKGSLKCIVKGPTEPNGVWQLFYTDGVGKDPQCEKKQCTVPTKKKAVVTAIEGSDTTTQTDQIGNTLEFGTKLTYKCDTGYYSVAGGKESSEFSISCNEDGEFTEGECELKKDFCPATTVVCKPEGKDCMPLEDRQYGPGMYGAKELVPCNAGFANEDQMDRWIRCEPDQGSTLTGHWYPAPVCTEINPYCDQMDATETRQLISQGVIGDEVQVTCNNGYKKHTDKPLTCQKKIPNEKKGQWLTTSNEEPDEICVINTEYCKEQTIPHGDGKQGTQKLPDTQIDKTAQAKCDEGYLMQGKQEQEVTCKGVNSETGRFDPSPKCDLDENYCPEVKSETFKEDVKSDNLGGSEELVCAYGYEYEGKTQIELECIEGKKWQIKDSETIVDEHFACTLKESYCKSKVDNAKDGTPLGHINGEEIEVKGNDVSGKLGDEASWTKENCENGHQEVDAYTIRCEAGTGEQGAWKPLPVCRKEAVYCKETDEFKEKGVAKLPGAEIDADILPNCLPGWAPTGKKFRCTKEDDAPHWQVPEEDPCEKIEKYCTQVIKNGIDLEAKVDEEAEVECHDGYKTEAGRVTCLATQKFNPIPHCAQIDDYCSAQTDKGSQLKGPIGVKYTSEEMTEQACQLGAAYEFSGPVECLKQDDGGKWTDKTTEASHDKIPCTEVKKWCDGFETGVPQNFDYASIKNCIESDSQPLGTVCSGQCRVGFKPKAGESIDFECGSNKKFKVQNDNSCEQIDDFCEANDALKIRKGGIDAELTEWECGEAQIKKVDKIVCMRRGDSTKGSWEAVEPTELKEKICMKDPNYCQAIESIENAFAGAAIPAGAVDQKASYLCATGYWVDQQEKDFPKQRLQTVTCTLQEGEKHGAWLPETKCQKAKCYTNSWGTSEDSHIYPWTGFHLIMKDDDEGNKKPQREEKEKEENLPNFKKDPLEYEDTKYYVCEVGYVVKGRMQASQVYFTAKCNEYGVIEKTNEKAVGKQDSKCEQDLQFCAHRIGMEGEIDYSPMLGKQKIKCKDGYADKDGEKMELTCRNPWAEAGWQKGDLLESHKKHAAMPWADKDGKPVDANVKIQEQCQIIEGYCEEFEPVQKEEDKTIPTKVKAAKIWEPVTIVCHSGYEPEASYYCGKKRGDLERQKGGSQLVKQTSKNNYVEPKCKAIEEYCFPFGVEGEGLEELKITRKLGDTVKAFILQKLCPYGYEYTGPDLVCSENQVWGEADQPDKEYVKINDNVAKLKCTPKDPYCPKLGDIKPATINAPAVFECEKGMKKPDKADEIRCVEKTDKEGEFARDGEAIDLKDAQCKEASCDGIPNVVEGMVAKETFKYPCGKTEKVTGILCCRRKQWRLVKEEADCNKDFSDDNFPVAPLKKPCEEVFCDLPTSVCDNHHVDKEQLRIGAGKNMLTCRMGYITAQANCRGVQTRAQTKEKNPHCAVVECGLDNTITWKEECTPKTGYCQFNQVVSSNEIPRIFGYGNDFNPIKNWMDFNNGGQTIGQVVNIKCETGFQFYPNLDPKVECSESNFEKGAWKLSDGAELGEHVCFPKTCNLPTEIQNGKIKALYTTNFQKKGVALKNQKTMNYAEVLEFDCDPGFAPPHIADQLNSGKAAWKYGLEVAVCTVDEKSSEMKLGELENFHWPRSETIRVKGQIYREKFTGCKALDELCALPKQRDVPGFKFKAGTRTANSVAQVTCPIGQKLKRNYESQAIPNTDGTKFKATCEPDVSEPKTYTGMWNPRPEVWSSMCGAVDNFCATIEKNTEQGFYFETVQKGKEGEMRSWDQENCDKGAKKNPNAAKLECRNIGGHGQWTMTDQSGTVIDKKEWCEPILCQEFDIDPEDPKTGSVSLLNTTNCEPCYLYPHLNDGKECSCTLQCSEKGFPLHKEAKHHPRCEAGVWKDIPQCVRTFQIFSVEWKDKDKKSGAHLAITFAKVKFLKDGVSIWEKATDENGLLELREACWEEEKCKLIVEGPDGTTPEIIYLTREDARREEWQIYAYLSEAVKGRLEDQEDCRIDLSQEFEIRATLVWENRISDLDIMVRNKECWDNSINYFKEECEASKGMRKGNEKTGKKTCTDEEIEEKAYAKWKDVPSKPATKIEEKYNIGALQKCWMKKPRTGPSSLSTSPQQIFKWIEASYCTKMYMDGPPGTGESKTAAQIGLDVDARMSPGQETVTLLKVPAGTYELIVVIGSGMDSTESVKDANWKPAPTVKFYLPGFEKQSAAVKCTLKMTKTCKAVPMWRVGVIKIDEHGRIRIYEGKKGWAEEKMKKIDLPRREHAFSQYTADEKVPFERAQTTPVIVSLSDQDPAVQENCISNCEAEENAGKCLVKD